MKRNIAWRQWLVVGLVVTVRSTVLAQPQQNRPANQVPRQQPSQQQMQQAMEQAQRLMQMTPEQLQREMLKMKEQLVRSELTRAGFNDPQLQDRVWDFLQEQETARQPVREAATKIYLGIEPKGTPVTDAEMEALLNGYQAAVEAESARRETALADLDAQISYSKSPRLRAVLTLYGYIGDQAWFTGDTLMGASVIGTLAPYVTPNARAPALPANGGTAARRNNDAAPDNAGAR
jgi:hypothetical protein